MESDKRDQGRLGDGSSAATGSSRASIAAVARGGLGMSGPCAAGTWGFWWIFPLLGALVCLAIIAVAVRFIATGRGFVCMTGHPAAGSDDTAELRRENTSLREEVRLLKAAG